MVKMNHQTHMAKTTLSLPPPDSRPFVQTNAFFESRLQVIRPGSSLRLECSATGAPAPNLKWFLDDRLLKAVSLLVSSLGMPAVSLAPPTRPRHLGFESGEFSVSK